MPRRYTRCDPFDTSPVRTAGHARQFSVLECVVNISEGRDQQAIERLIRAAEPDLLDVHLDPHHNRSVFTLVGESAPRRLAQAAVDTLDLRTHDGVHPRIGVVDVVPFIALGDTITSDALDARDRFCEWAARELALPCFRYGGERSLPEIRRSAFTTLKPDTGPALPHPTAGACAVGARELLVAYNVWVEGADLAAVRRCAAAVRSPVLRTLGLAVGDRLQVSCNLIAPLEFGPRDAVEQIRSEAPDHGLQVVGTELVGLVPHAVLEAAPEVDRAFLDLGVESTIEARLARIGR